MNQPQASDWAAIIKIRSIQVLLFIIAGVLIFIALVCLFRKTPFEFGPLKIYACTDTIRIIDTVQITTNTNSGNPTIQKPDLKGVTAQFLNLGTTNGNTYEHNTMTIVQDTGVDIKTLPVSKQQLAEYTQGIMQFNLPSYSEHQKALLFKEIDSFRVASKLDRDVTLTIDKKSDGILVYYQLLDLLRAKGYNIADMRFSNFSDLDKKKQVFGFISNNRMHIVVGNMGSRN